MITGAQIRMARAALGWTVAELARRSGVSASSIQRAESADGVPTMQSTNLFRVQRTLEIGDERGAVTFIDADESGGEGVRLRRR
jgi:transcriptional regulator with XRE-family HTH domain